MKNKHLKPEIKTLLSSVEKAFGKDSIQYQNLDYYLDILITVYEYNYNSEKDLLGELKALLTQLSREMPELIPEQLYEKYPNINKMINYLDIWLTD
ncbi:hypothetical protein EV204_101323 [Tissierella praeacuta]|uniref:hypothetical protein n=1 Tax=Tissierella praeacuta TaxID=43131 RepID=UPI00104F9728|nr:hypothetical protein [Tissierella praeacuta]TCU79344.1 hypothetical protein EV204_101323 [Tissierella praeacuta]